MLAMSVPALFLGIGCALLYAAADMFRKSAPKALGPEIILFYFVGGHIPVLALWALVTGETSVQSAYLLPGILCAACGLAANLLFIVAIRRSPLSLMIPLLALVPVLTLLFAGVVLGEWPTSAQALGIVLVTVGLLTLFKPGEAKPGFAAAWRTLRTEAGTVPMLAVVVLWSATAPLDKLGIESSSVGMHGLIQVTFIWVALAVWLARGGRAAFRLPSPALLPVGAAAVTGAFGYALLLAAYSVALVAMVEVVRRTVGLLIALVVGRLAFGEPITRTKVIGVGIVALGLPLVMWT